MYFRYFFTSPSMGTMFASTLRWVIVTPLGSAVAPEVKMISMRSWGSGFRISAFACQRFGGSAVALPKAERVRAPTLQMLDRRGRSERLLTDLVADQDQFRVNDASDLRHELCRRAKIDGHQDRACEECAPHRDDPLGPVLAPDDHLVVCADTARGQSRAERPCGGAHFAVRHLADAVPIVVHDE